MMRTFLDVFPHATLWLDGTLMLGSLEPLAIEPSVVWSRREHPQTAAALDDIGLRDFETLSSWYTAGPDDMRALVDSGAVLTDDRPLIEYHRSLPATDPPMDLTELRADVSQVIRR